VLQLRVGFVCVYRNSCGDRWICTPFLFYDGLKGYRYTRVYIAIEYSIIIKVKITPQEYADHAEYGAEVVISASL